MIDVLIEREERGGCISTVIIIIVITIVMIQKTGCLPGSLLVVIPT